MPSSMLLLVNLSPNDQIRSDHPAICFESSGGVSHSLFKPMCILFSLPPEFLFYVGEKLSPLDLGSLEIAFEGTRYETFIRSLTTKLAHNLSKTYPLPTDNMVSNVEDFNILVTDA
jgi:hypothetical protein